MAHAITPEEFRLKCLPTLDRASKTENDGDCVLICGAIIEKSLSTLLTAAFIQENNKTEELPGYMSSVSNMAQTAYLLRLIDKLTYEVVISINKIRNVFAHTIENRTFADAELMKLRNGLSVYDTSWAGNYAKMSKQIQEEYGTFKGKLVATSRVVVLYIATRLYEMETKGHTIGLRKITHTPQEESQKDEPD